ncbi:MAG: T3SS (YopN, CesT) and YbjN peptide-binding chaperone 1 [Candidatus Hydrothermia bacterium]
MSYANEKHEAAHRQLGEMLKRLFGEANIGTLDDITYYIWSGSTVVHFTTETYGRDDEPMVEIWAKVTVGTPLSDALARYLIVENSNLNFGGFRFYPWKDDPNTGNVVFEQRLPFYMITDEAIEHFTEMVAWTGDHYDQDIAQTYGGKTMKEIVSEPDEGSSKDEEWEK